MKSQIKTSMNKAVAAGLAASLPLAQKRVYGRAHPLANFAFAAPQASHSPASIAAALSRLPIDRRKKCWRKPTKAQRMQRRWVLAILPR